MKFKLIFFCFFIFSFVAFAQNDKCKLKISYDLSGVVNTGDISFSVTNISSEKTKVLKEYHNYKVQMENVSIYNSDGSLLNKNLGTADIDFFKPGKTKMLKPNKSKTYKINIFGTLQGSRYLNRNQSYQFDLWFNFVDLVDYKFNCDIIGVSEIKNLKYQSQIVSN